MWELPPENKEPIIDALEKLDLRYPAVDDAKKKELAAARRLLNSE